MSVPTTFSRRGVLAGGAGAGLLGVGAILASGSANAVAMPLPAAARVVDVHHHFYPPAYLLQRRKEIIAVGPTFPQVLEWTPQQSLDAMDRDGVAKAVLSISTPGIWFDDPADARRLARSCNDYAADLARANPDRFAFFASLPLPDTAASLAEIAHALDKLSAVGIGLLTSYDGRYLGDPAFSTVLAELDRRSAVVYVHPTGADCCRNIASGLPMASMEFPFDTTRTIASLAFGGALSRYPNIRFIFSHGGGTVPFLVGRMGQSLRSRPDLAALMPGGLQATLARHYFDTVSISAPSAIAALKAFAPVDRLLFGTDFPYGALGAQLHAVDGFGFSPTDYARVVAGNADALLHPRAIRP